MPRGKTQRSLELIAAARRILSEIQPATVRAVCYRLFVEGRIPSMARRDIRPVYSQLKDARELSMIPWEWIVDETRQVERVAQWDSPHDFAEVVYQQFRRNAWSEQPRCAIEVWSEKSTVGGTLRPVLQQYGIHFRVFHGFGSAVSVHDPAQELRLRRGATLPPLVLYVGDWDPSGLCMSERDLPQRLRRYGGGHIELRRLALNVDDTHADLQSFSPDEKREDPRYQWFIANYPPRCWELDAMSPVTLRDRVEAAIVAELDQEAWDRAQRVEDAQRASLDDYLAEWEAATETPSQAAP